ncbi:cation:proton antiporter [bacterium]|nr:cation:proton antiporter [bacterium]
MLTPWLSHFPALVPLLSVAIVLTTGAVAQIVAQRLRIPALILLLAAGMGLGTSGLGLVDPTVYGKGLRLLVSCAVAIIVFEGALHIDLRQLRHSSRAVLGLITIGPVVTMGLAATAAHFLAGLPWKIAFLFGAIVSVTGPTVISPIIKRLAILPRLKTILEAESVLVDAVGVLLTASVFSFLTGSAGGVAEGLMQLGLNLACGGTVGALTAWLLKRGLGRGDLSAELVRLSVLAAVLLAFSVAEALAHESGIAAVAVAGLMVGSMGLPSEESVRRFKGDLTLVALNLVFILLAAGMPISNLVALGWGGLATVFALMFVVRPVAVMLATWPSALSWRERAFIAWLGPRGIVAASMASLMALELKAWGMAGAEPLGALVFLTVLLTVLIEGGCAGWIAARLNVMPKKLLIVGGSSVARKLALRLQKEGEAVHLIASERQEAQDAREAGLSASHGDPEKHEALATELANCKAVVVATESDARNLLVAQGLKARAPAVSLLALVNEARHLPAFQESGISPLSIEEATVDAMTGLLLRPSLLPLLRGSDQADRVVEIAVGNPRIAGLSLRELELPKDCLVALVRRAGAVSVPRGKTVLECGDVVTLIGLREAVDRTRTLLESDV